jgi:hypothetical protein
MAGGGLQADAPTSSIRASDPLAVLPLIEGIESLSTSSTGAFVFGSPGRPVGTILIEQGRICWAAAAKLGYRLTDILRSLVANGLLSSDGLRDALRQHTAEAILCLSQGGEEPSWVSHRRQRYDARFTFSPAEVLASAGAACLPELAEHARREVLATLRPESSAVAFTWVGLSAALFPICEVRSQALSARETVELGLWATRMLELPLMHRSVPKLVVTFGAKGDALVAWISEGIVYVVICQNPSSLAHVLGKRARAAPDVRSGS